MRKFHMSILAVALAAAGQMGAAPEAARPNIVVILADDLGIGCLSAYGGKGLSTPNIDRLAAQGMRFTDCFSNPYCSPSRASLLTGRYPFRNGLKEVIFDPKLHADTFLDANTQPSFARQLKGAGYATAIAGKWQLSFLFQRNQINQFGFDQYQCWQIFTDKAERTSRFHKPHFNENGTVIADRIANRYGPDVNVDFLIDFMKASHAKGQPFLAYNTSLLPHFPWVPTPDSEDKDYEEPKSVAKGDPKYFPDMVAYLDKTVGRIMDALDEMGIAENTVLVFLADNGTDSGLVNLMADGNAIQGGKGTMTDRGTHVPLIVRWPGKIKPGTVCGDLIDFSDLLPTLCEVAGADLPEETIHGRSFGPQLFGKPGVPREWIHVQDKEKRHVRSKEYILNNNNQLRPVVELWNDPAKPISGELSEEQQAARKKLQAALDELGK